MYYVQLDIHLFTHRDDVRYSWCNKIGNNLPCWLNHLMRRFLNLSVDEDVLLFRKYPYQQ